MQEPARQAAIVWPLAVYFFLVVLLAAAAVVTSWLLGQRHRDKSTNEPYESGVIPTGSARLRMSAKYYLIAMFFVIFDLEAAFIFAWSVDFRELGWAGYGGMMIFIAVLVATLVYLWGQGALAGGTVERKTYARRSR